MSVADPSPLTTLIFQSLFFCFCFSSFSFIFDFSFSSSFCSSDFFQSLPLQFWFFNPVVFCSYAFWILFSQLWFFNPVVFYSSQFSIFSSFAALIFKSLLRSQLRFSIPSSFAALIFKSLLLSPLWFLILLHHVGQNDVLRRRVSLNEAPPLPSLIDPRICALTAVIWTQSSLFWSISEWIQLVLINKRMNTAWFDQ